MPRKHTSRTFGWNAGSFLYAFSTQSHAARRQSVLSSFNISREALFSCGFGGGRKKVGHILKYKAHILKYVPCIFSFLKAICNHLKIRYNFHAHKTDIYRPPSLLQRINSREYLLKIPMHNETITFAWGYR